MTDTVRALARGLFTGEVFSWTNAQYRMRLLPAKRMSRMQTLTVFALEHGTTTPAVPYAHSSPAGLLQPGPGEASEWFAFSFAALGRVRSSGTWDDLTAAWRGIAGADLGAMRIGTRIPLQNIRRGLTAPHCGNDNPHYFDDMPMVRAVAAAAAFTDDASRLDAARRDAGFTASYDGLWCAEATATLFSRLLDGCPTETAVGDAVAALPAQCWSRRLAESAITAAVNSTGPLQLALDLSRTVVEHIYSYSTIAPQTLALLLAHLHEASSADSLLLGALAHHRSAATLPAIAGAAAALIFGESWIPGDIDLTLKLPGISLPAYAGCSIAEALGI